VQLAVPFLTTEHIECEAALLLAEYRSAYPLVTTLPIPVDDIVEFHLKLTLEIKDLTKLLKVSDVYGAIWFNARRVGIDMSLDPFNNPAKRGRFHFTVAHEVGHWRLHRHLYLRPAGMQPLFADGDAAPDYICRSSEKKKPVEWQADFFAANLLMPRDLVRAAWQEWRGDLDPVALDDLEDLRKQVVTEDVLRRGGFEANDSAAAAVAADMVLEQFSRPLASKFAVSPEAMRIRLDELHLLVRKKQATLFD
jgi:Zn-dependent peptidase ImmA (M78 family)